MNKHRNFVSILHMRAFFVYPTLSNKSEIPKKNPVLDTFLYWLIRVQSHISVISWLLNTLIALVDFRNVFFSYTLEVLECCWFLP